MARGKYFGSVGNTPGHVQHWSRRGFLKILGRRLDVMRDLPCQRCHGQTVIPDRLIYDQEGFGRVFAIDHVLTNDGRCNKCHEDAGPVLGNILVEVSLTEHDLVALAARRRLMVSIMCTGMRMVRAWSAMARVMACRIHHVA